MIFCNIPLQESLYEKNFRSTINLYQQDFKAINFTAKRNVVFCRGGRGGYKKGFSRHLFSNVHLEYYI